MNLKKWFFILFLFLFFGIANQAVFASDDITLTLAVGASYKPVVSGSDVDVMFTSSKPKIASINKKGLIVGKAVGTSSITATTRNASGQAASQTYFVEITNPSVTFMDTSLTKGSFIPYEVSGSSSSMITVSSSDQSVISITEDNQFYIQGGGYATLSVLVDGKDFSREVHIIVPRMEEAIYLLAKGDSISVKTIDFPADAPVQYSIDNKKMATISEDGVLTPKKSGNAILTVTCNDITVQCGIAVTTKRAAESVKRAQTAIGSQYSQSFRMQEGYYDCSSLIWRSFQESGLNFGSETWAPTAADLALYTVEHNLILSETSLPISELQAGDLIFYSSKENGRFKNIDHVAIFSGYLPTPLNWYTEDTYLGSIIEAGSRGVVQGFYQESSTIVLIARPPK